MKWVRRQERQISTAARKSPTFSRRSPAKKARGEDAARQMAKMADEMRAAQERQGATASTEIANLQQALTREKARSEDANMADGQFGGRDAGAAGRQGEPRIDLETRAPTVAAMEMLNAPPPFLATGAITVSRRGALRFAQAPGGGGPRADGAGRSIFFHTAER